MCKHNANDPKCTELGWVCIPALAVETYGCWGVEAQGSIFLAGCPSSFAVAVQQVKGHCKHLPETEPHLSSLQCQSLAEPCYPMLGSSIQWARAEEVFFFFLLSVVYVCTMCECGNYKFIVIVFIYLWCIVM